MGRAVAKGASAFARGTKPLWRSPLARRRLAKADGASATRERGEQDSLLVQGRTEEAMAEWRKALALDPGNWIIHQQIWAVEHPEAFYEGAVDYDWQKQQRRREEAAAGGASPQ